MTSDSHGGQTVHKRIAAGHQAGLNDVAVTYFLDLQADAARAIAQSPYAEVIRCWATVIGRPAPHPTEQGTRGQPRLAPTFSEWLMGLPAGHVTDAGLPYGAQLRAIGNGVMPLQAERALTLLTRAATSDMERRRTPDN